MPGPNPDVELPSRRYGNYRLRMRLGTGGMAEVFLADVVDESGESRNVAIKLMREGAPEAMFADEADLMGMLQPHPNLVQRLEIGHAFGRPFIAMEYLLGGDLAGQLKKLRREGQLLAPELTLHFTVEILKGLAHFHQAKTRTGRPLALVHGDINPANVFFSGAGEVKLGDFGVAKSHLMNLGPAQGITAGKLHYLSPEQTRGEALTSQSDLFAVGVMLHELLIGAPPFLPAEQDPDKVFPAIRAGRLSLPSTLEKPLAGIVRKALAVELGARYRTAGELAGELCHYALDRDLTATSGDVCSWLERMAGI